MAREMKDSGIAWIGYIPCSWETLPIHSAFTERREKVSDTEWEPLSVTKSGVVKQLEHAAKSDNHNDRKKVCIGDFAINSRSDRKESCGLSSMNGSVSLINTVLIANASLYSSKYVKYLLKNYGFAEEFYRWGTGIVADLWSTNFERMKNIKLPLPPLSEQQKIADFLDEKVKEIDNAIEKTKETIELYKKYKQAIITEAVTKGLDPNVEMKDSGIEWINQIPVKWNVNRLKNLFSFGKGLPITKANLKESGLPVISYGQIHSKTNSGVCVKKELVRFVSQSYYESNPESMTKKGDIIVADTSEDLEGCGNAVYINDDFNIFAGYHTVILKSKENKSNKYIAYLMKTDLWRSQIRTLVTSVKVFSITQSILKQCSVILPPKDSQEEIVDFLDDECSSIDAIVNKMSSLIPAYENYKKSLIYEYVTGKKEVK